MAVELEAALVPVPVRRAQAQMLESIPAIESLSVPPRVHMDPAMSALKEMLPWGETGREFLKNLFFDPGRRDAELSRADILDHCAGKYGGSMPEDLDRQVVRQLDRFEACGLVIVERSGVFQNRYRVNPTPGVEELLGLSENEGGTVVVTKQEALQPLAAKELLEATQFGAPFREGVVGSSVAAKMLDRVMLSELLKSDDLFEPGSARGWNVRARLLEFINAGIAAGVFRFELLDKGGEQRELYSVTPEAQPLVKALLKS